jgi:hypothetical protein
LSANREAGEKDLIPSAQRDGVEMTKAPRRREKAKVQELEIRKEGSSVHRHHRVSKKRDLQQPQDHDDKPPDSLSLQEK